MKSSSNRTPPKSFIKALSTRSPPVYSKTSLGHRTSITLTTNQKPYLLTNLASSDSFRDDSDAYEQYTDDEQAVRPNKHNTRTVPSKFSLSRHSLEQISASSRPVKPDRLQFDGDSASNAHVQRPPPFSKSPKPRRKILKPSSSTTEAVSSLPPTLSVTPLDQNAASGASGSTLNPRFLARKSASSPTLHDIRQSPPPYSPPEQDLHFMPPNPYPEDFIPASSSSSSLSYPSRSHIRSRPHSRTHSSFTSPKNSDTEDDLVQEGSDSDMIYTSRSSPTMHPLSSVRKPGIVNSSRQNTGSNQSLRSRIFAFAVGGRTTELDRGDREDKVISTTPGLRCAGETETETDEPSRHLPTARIVQTKGPLVPPNTFQEKLTPLLFEFSRLLSIVPALIGTMYNIYHFIYPIPQPDTPTPGRAPPDALDFFVAALWSILTGYQCLCLTTGLLTRWRLYYQPLSTLVRLLALQGICWPATHLTLTVLQHSKRPALTWAVIGTTTCCSRSVQIWVTSNLWWERRNSAATIEDDQTPTITDGDGGQAAGVGASSTSLSSHLHHFSELAAGGRPMPPTQSIVTAASSEENRRGYLKRFGGGKWGGRRWDWKEVGLRCVLPAGVLYFMMALVGEIRREFFDSSVAISGGWC